MTWQVAQRTALPPVPRARTPCAGAMAADSLDEVPVVDLATMSAAEAASVLDAALRRYGFFYVSGHGIPEELIAQQCVPTASAQGNLTPTSAVAPPERLRPPRRAALRNPRATPRRAAPRGRTEPLGLRSALQLRVSDDDGRARREHVSGRATPR